jgi:hypothetical protein
MKKYSGSFAARLGSQPVELWLLPLAGGGFLASTSAIAA